MTIDVLQDGCYGCTACYAVCPKQSIKMEDDIGLFKYPQIDQSQCIDCGLCMDVCPQNNNIKKDYLQIYAYQNQDELRQKSSSGGFFSLISDYVLNKNGVVYGAAFSQSFSVRHIRAEDKTERNKMRTSKYVQSELGDTLQCVREDLKNDRNVIFTGTPCQVAGLLNYLRITKTNDEKLITCDFVCHGVPSPAVWKDYLAFIESKYHDKVQGVCFRNKTLGWHKPTLQIKMEKATISETESQSAFYHLFYSNCILRKACHTCEFTKLSRVSDITMGDCWGIEESHPEIDDNKGTSLLLINSEKGLDLFKKITIGTHAYEIDVSDIRQPHLFAPARMSKNREIFWQEYKSKPFIKILNKYGHYSQMSRLVYTIKRILVRVIRK